VGYGRRNAEMRWTNDTFDGCVSDGYTTERELATGRKVYAERTHTTSQRK
jgi:hypothetical protein